MAARRPTIAIAGATGHLGQYITEACLDPAAKKNFSKVVLLSRKPASTSSQLSKWQDELGAVVRCYEEQNLSGALADVDVVINAVGPAGHEFKDALLRSLEATPVRLYFPSEFGVNHTVHDFPHEEWGRKKHHYEIAGQLSSKIKVCRIFNGLFTEDSIGPWFGFHTKENRYECVGSADTASSYTSLPDVGRTVAVLAATDPDRIPAKLTIGGDTVTIREIAALMQEAGAGNISVQELDLADFKRQALAEPTADPGKCLRFLMGENNINHTAGALGNDNDFVNPGEKSWKWLRMSEYARTVGGRPWV